MSGPLFLSSAVGNVPPEWTGNMSRVCAWCDASMGTTPCIPEADGAVTHGICDSCATKQLRDLTAESFAAINPNERTTTMPDTMPRSALELRELTKHLGDHARRVIYQAEHSRMTFGEHHVWRRGAMAYTARGLRVLAEAFDAERDGPAAIVCRREAARLEQEDREAAVSVEEEAEASIEHEAWENLERRGLA